MNWSFQKRGQITLFAILGIFLLVIVVMLFIIISNTQKGHERRELPIDRIMKELESGFVKNHIAACISTLSSEGLEKLGANGGILYDFEGGRVPAESRIFGNDYLNTTLQGTKYYIQYGLVENKICPLIDYSIPNYPFAGKKVADLMGLFDSDDKCYAANPAAGFDGFFGQVTLPKLCYSAMGSGCEDFAKGQVIGMTIQKQLEDYISSKLPDCINLSIFEEELDAQISQESSALVRVNVHDSDLDVNVDYPFRIVFREETPVIKSINYKVTLKVALGSVYNFLYSILSDEARKPDFAFRKHFISSMYWKPGFEARKLKGSCFDCPSPQSYDYIIEVFDRNSELNGKPFFFRTGVQNRRPVLDPLDDKTYDLALLAGGSILDVDMPVFAFDPDDEPLSYYFLFDGPVSLWPSQKDRLVFSPKGVSIKFPLSYDDFGNHTSGILVIDESGLFDFQWFNITVIDSTGGYPGTEDCLLKCTDLISGSGADCNYWCWLAGNPCLAFCNQIDEKSFDPGSSCSKCVDRIYYLNNPPVHDTCPLLSKDFCITMMTDCFWLEEPNALSNLYKCISDTELLTTAPGSRVISVV